MKIYTAGPMEHVSTEVMRGYRDYLTERLSHMDVDFVDPTRRTPLHDQETVELSTFNKLKRIVAQDMRDIDGCDMLVADLRDSMPGKKWGTVMEIQAAHLKGKIILVLTDENQFKHPFVYAYATEVHHSLDDLRDAIVDYLD